MADKINKRIKATLAATVERVYQGDNISVTLAGFEYSYMADIFAKAISKETDGVVLVRNFGRTYPDCAFENGKKHTGWAMQLAWEGEAL